MKKITGDDRTGRLSEDTCIDNVQMPSPSREMGQGLAESWARQERKLMLEALLHVRTSFASSIAAANPEQFWI